MTLAGRARVALALIPLLAPLAGVGMTTANWPTSELGDRTHRVWR